MALCKIVLLIQSFKPSFVISSVSRICPHLRRTLILSLISSSKSDSSRFDSTSPSTIIKNKIGYKFIILFLKFWYNSTLFQFWILFLGFICVCIESYFALFMLFSVAHYSAIGMAIQSELTQVLLFLVGLIHVLQPLAFVGEIIRRYLCLSFMSSNYWKVFCEKFKCKWDIYILLIADTVLNLESWGTSRAEEIDFIR